MVFATLSRDLAGDLEHSPTMPPSIALVVCVLLILVALKLDTDTRGGATVSSALWIPTIWMLIMGSRMISQWLVVGSSLQSLESYEDGSPMDRNIFLLLIVAAAVVLLARRAYSLSFLRKNIWLSCFLIYCGISIAWSDFPLVSLKRYVKDIGNLLMVMVVLTDRHSVQALSTIGKRCAYILIPLSIVMYKYFPQLGRGYSVWTGDLFVTGVTNNKNSLGALALVCGLFLVWSLLLARRRDSPLRSSSRAIVIMVLMLMMTTWTLVVSNSATSLACLPVGSAIMIVAPLIKTRPLLIPACCGIALIGVAVVEIWGGGLMSVVLTSLGRDSTLTGRTDLWKDVLALSAHPLIGVGFGSFWLGDRMEALWSKYWWHPTEAHNGYVEIYLELGYIGLLLLAAVLLSAFRSTVRALGKNSDCARFQMALLIVVVLYNFTEAGFRVDLLMYFMFLFAVIDTTHAYQAVTNHGAIASDCRKIPANPSNRPYVGRSQKAAGLLTTQKQSGQTVANH